MTAEQLGWTVGAITFVASMTWVVIWHRRDQRERKKRAAIYDSKRKASAPRPIPPPHAPEDRSRMRTVPEMHRFARPATSSRVGMPVSRPIPLGPRAVVPAPLARRTRVAPVRVSDDADDDLWLRRSDDVAMDIAADVAVAAVIDALTPSHDSTPTPEPSAVFEGGGGEFGGGGASGSWDAPSSPDSAPSVDTSFDPPSSGGEA